MGITVYFDTCFYVALARAGEDEAQAAITAMNDTAARTVLSLPLLRELLASVDRPEKDEILLDRLSRLELPSYRTDERLTWDALRYHGVRRREFADVLKRLAPKIARAESASLVANPESTHRLREPALQATLEDLDLPDAGQASSEDMLAALQPMLATSLGALGIRVPEPLTQEALADLQTALLALLPGQALERVEQHGRLVASATANDARPYESVLGTVSEKSLKKLGHTLRDADHMLEFCQHADEVDLLQLDGPQWRQLQHLGKRHELSRAGLAERCFRADGLSAVAEVRKRA